MSTKTEAPAGCNRSGAKCNCVKPCLTCNCNHNTCEKQQPPKLGSAARSYLKRYAADLIDYAEAGDRITSSLIDCCNFLLIEADRLEGVWHD
jgi:hypothetical protein